jgi:hypothetical protein
MSTQQDRLDELYEIMWNCGGNNDTSGGIHFHIVWRPLTDDGFIEVV